MKLHPVTCTRKSTKKMHAAIGRHRHIKQVLKQFAFLCGYLYGLGLHCISAIYLSVSLPIGLSVRLPAYWSICLHACMLFYSVFLLACSIRLFYPPVCLFECLSVCWVACVFDLPLP